MYKLVYKNMEKGKEEIVELYYNLKNKEKRL